MTPTGTFIINGAERVIVSQLHKFARRVLRNQDPPERPRASCPRASSPTAAPGSSSNTMSTTSCGSPSTAARACSAPPSCALLATRPTKTSSTCSTAPNWLPSAGRSSRSITTPMASKKSPAASWPRTSSTPRTGEILADAGMELTEQQLDRIIQSNAKEIKAPPPRGRFQGFHHHQYLVDGPHGDLRRRAARNLRAHSPRRPRDRRHDPHLLPEAVL